MRAENIKWVSSGGGPLLLVPDRCLADWDGGQQSRWRNIDAQFRYGPDPHVPATDYDRACDVSHEYLAIITVGNGEGLVLGDEPLATAWYPDDRATGGILIRWSAAEDTAHVLDTIRTAAKEIWEPESFSFPVPPGSLHLFDSAYVGREWVDIPDDGKFTFSTAPGRYSLATAVYDPDDETSLILHRFLWSEGV